MKKYNTLLMVVAVAFLFVGQSDSLAKTAKSATQELSKVRDGETYYRVEAPKTFQVKSETSEDETGLPKLGKLFEAKVEALRKRVSWFWDQVLPMIDKIYYKYIAVVD